MHISWKAERAKKIKVYPEKILIFHDYLASVLPRVKN